MADTGEAGAVLLPVRPDGVVLRGFSKWVVMRLSPWVGLGHDRWSPSPTTVSSASPARGLARLPSAGRASLGSAAVRSGPGRSFLPCSFLGAFKHI